MRVYKIADIINGEIRLTRDGEYRRGFYEKILTNLKQYPPVENLNPDFVWTFKHEKLPSIIRKNESLEQPIPMNIGESLLIFFRNGLFTSESLPKSEMDLEEIILRVRKHVYDEAADWAALKWNIEKETFKIIKVADVVGREIRYTREGEFGFRQVILFNTLYVEEETNPDTAWKLPVRNTWFEIPPVGRISDSLEQPISLGEYPIIFFHNSFFMPERPLTNAKEVEEMLSRVKKYDYSGGQDLSVLNGYAEPKNIPVELNSVEILQRILSTLGDMKRDINDLRCKTNDIRDYSTKDVISILQEISSKLDK